MTVNTIDFLQKLVEILNNQNYFAPVVSGGLKNGNSIAVISMPSKIKQHFYNGSYLREFAIQINVKHEQQLEIIETIEKITNLLTNIEDIPSDLNSYKFEAMELSTTPNLLEVSEKYCIYSAQFTAELLIQGGF
jgi:hypothetical protein